MIVDVHSHFVSPSLIDIVSRGDFGPQVTALTTREGVVLKFPSTESRPFFDKITSLDRRIRHMNEVGIDVQVLSTWADIYGYDLPTKVASKYHSLTNEQLAASARKQRERFRFLASLPLPWVEESLRVLKEARDLGAVGAMVGTNVNGNSLADPNLDPLWDRIEDLDLPVFLHPVNVAAAERLKSYYLHNLLGNPFDTTIAATSLVLGGALDRHPRLRVVLLHGGGYFPLGIGRIDHGFENIAAAHTSKNPPSSYLRRFYYDAIVYHPKILKSLSDMVGTDRLLFGTDYPFDMEPKDLVRMSKAIFSDESSLILGRNAQRLFGSL